MNSGNQTLRFTRGESFVGLRRVPRLNLFTTIGAVVIALFGAWLVFQLGTNQGFEWDVVAQYIFSPTILHGAWITILLTVLTMVFGTVLGIILAIMRLSRNPVLEITSTGFVWFFRSTPALVQLIFWFNLASLFPEFALGIPFGGPKFVEFDTNVVITSFTAALLGLGLNEAAYMAEIVRGGILSVDPGQREAALALGMKPRRTFMRVVLPQAMRAIIPPTGNQVIGMLKYTSLASVVALGELLSAAQDIYNRTFQIIPLLIVASIWYLVMTTVLSMIQSRIERRYARGDRMPQVSAITQSVKAVTSRMRVPKAARGQATEGGQ
ncbi:amino acid ABC transporter permease [Arthrobacter sp. NPDC055138]